MARYEMQCAGIQHANKKKGSIMGSRGTSSFAVNWREYAAKAVKRIAYPKKQSQRRAARPGGAAL